MGPEEIATIESRASEALGSHFPDEAITIPVLGQDVIRLLNERRVLLAEIEQLNQQLERQAKLLALLNHQ